MCDTGKGGGGRVGKIAVVRHVNNPERAEYVKDELAKSWIQEDCGYQRSGRGHYIMMEDTNVYP